MGVLLDAGSSDESREGDELFADEYRRRMGVSGVDLVARLEGGISGSSFSLSIFVAGTSLGVIGVSRLIVDVDEESVGEPITNAFLRLGDFGPLFRSSSGIDKESEKPEPDPPEPELSELSELIVLIVREFLLLRRTLFLSGTRREEADQEVGGAFGNLRTGVTGLTREENE